MRGKVNCFSVKGLSVRITPAYAGKRNIDKAPNPEHWDHPRLCGEKEHLMQCAVCGAGITPAYAGKRVSTSFFNPHS